MKNADPYKGLTGICMVTLSCFTHTAKKREKKKQIKKTKESVSCNIGFHRHLFHINEVNIPIYMLQG